MRPNTLTIHLIKPEVRDQLIAEPLTVRDVAGRPTAFYNSNYVGTSDLENLRTRQNAARKVYLASGKLDITTTPTVNLTIGVVRVRKSTRLQPQQHPVERGEQ